jgi:hypothetical protein
MVEFIKDTHTYLVDGVIVPSVSTILKEVVFSDKYKDVPDFVLKRAAEFGTAIHDAIEHNDSILLNDEQQVVYDRWLALKDTHNITPVKHEQIVHYEKEYAGTFDMIAMIDGEECLVDIKTTYNLDVEYLSWQLSMYALAYGFSGRLYAIWLPKKRPAQLIEIKYKEQYEIDELLEVYYALQENRTTDQEQW